MKVVVDYRSALRARTGAGEYLFNTLRALARRPSSADTGGSAAGGPPLDLTLFSSSWKDRPVAADLAQLPGVHVVDRRIPVNALNLMWHRLGWPPVELVAGRRFDVAWSGHPLLMPARHAARVVTIHDLDFLAHPERATAEIRRDYPKLVRAHAHRANHVIVPSHYTARQVENELGVSVSRITVCYPGAPEWSPSKSDAREKRCVLFVGTLERRKNLGTLLAAYGDVLARRPDVPPLVLAGGTRPEAATWLDALEKPPLAGKARYLGYVSDPQRRELYQTAAVFVLPSYEEGFGMPALEAMAAGVPIIVSNRGALPEVAGDAGIVVEPEDRDALSGAIERVLTDDAFAAASAAKGLQRARRFRWTETARSVLEAFARALEANHG